LEVYPGYRIRSQPDQQKSIILAYKEIISQSLWHFKFIVFHKDKNISVASYTTLTSATNHTSL